MTTSNAQPPVEAEVESVCGEIDLGAEAEGAVWSTLGVWGGLIELGR